MNSVAVPLQASQHAAASGSGPVVLADAGVENVNAQVDALIAMGVLRRLLAGTELKCSNSLIEAWWRWLKHQWLFPPTRQRPDGSPAGGVLCRRTRWRAAALGLSRSDHGRDVLRNGRRDRRGTRSARTWREARLQANRSATCETCPALTTMM